MDSFGRPLLAVDLGTESGFDGFALEMLAAGHAVPYEKG
jgi:endonuclease YncB( thermonuclease family)